MRKPVIPWIVLISIAAASCATAEDATRPQGVEAGVDAKSGDAAATGGSDAGKACTPGKQEACPCLGGVQGVQVCKPDGSGFLPCTCPDASTGNAGSGGSGGTGGSTGSGGSGGATGGSGGSAGAGGAGGQTGSGGSGTGGAGTGGSTGGGGGATGNPDVCPGAVVTLPAYFNDDTSNYADQFHYMCGNAETGKDVAYQFVAPSTGTVTVTVQPQGFSAVVAYSSNTCLPTAVAACKWGVSIGAATTLQFAANAGTTYWVFVDGYSLSGPFSISIVP